MNTDNIDRELLDRLRNIRTALWIVIVGFIVEMIGGAICITCMVYDEWAIGLFGLVVMAISYGIVKASAYYVRIQGS